jgi:hypothetical protein
MISETIDNLSFNEKITKRIRQAYNMAYLHAAIELHTIVSSKLYKKC